jgi:hypothetical protein
MTVLTAIKKVCAVTGLTIPDVVFASDQREHQEMTYLANEMGRRIVFEHDWSKLKALTTITGDGVSVSFPVPVTYGRMLKEGQIWSSKRRRVPLTHVVDTDTWLADKIAGDVPENPQWTMFGSSLNIFPAPAIGEVLSYYYIPAFVEFAADADVFPLNERLLSLGMIWQWKANKGLPYAEDMQNYEIEMKALIRHDMGADIMAVGLDRYRPNTQFITLKELTP